MVVYLKYLGKLKYNETETKATIIKAHVPLGLSKISK